MRQLRTASILCRSSKSGPPSFSARGAHRIGVSSAMQADKIESAPVSRALRRSVKTGGAGAGKPRSTCETELEAVFVIFAGCSWRHAAAMLEAGEISKENYGRRNAGIKDLAKQRCPKRPLLLCWIYLSPPYPMFSNE